MAYQDPMALKNLEHASSDELEAIAMQQQMEHTNPIFIVDMLCEHGAGLDDAMEAVQRSMEKRAKKKLRKVAWATGWGCLFLAILLGVHLYILGQSPSGLRTPFLDSQAISLTLMLGKPCVILSLLLFNYAAFGLFSSFKDLVCKPK